MLVAVSLGVTAQEQANLVNPVVGDYTVYVHGFSVPAGGANLTLFSWLLGTAATSNMTVTAPASATIGATGAINLTFGGLTPGAKYLGSVAYAGTSGLPNPTIVRVDP